MRENLSAPGTVSDWLNISKKAFQNLDYHDITQDPKYARLSARYGYDEYILVNIRNKDENRVLLEFDVSSPKMIQQFKTASAQIVRQQQKKREQRIEEKKFGKAPTYHINSDLKEKQVDTSNNINSANIVETIKDTVPDYEAEEGDYIERTRSLPDDTLMFREYREDLDRLESDSLRYKFRHYFNKLWLILLLLVVCPPIGIFLLWYFHRLKIFTRILVTIFTFLYFALIWVGFFGIDTGLNKESIQMFYNNQQYKITRFFNQFNNETEHSDVVVDDTTTDPNIDQTDTNNTNSNPIIDFFTGIGESFDKFFDRGETIP